MGNKAIQKTKIAKKNKVQKHNHITQADIKIQTQTVNKKKIQKKQANYLNKDKHYCIVKFSAGNRNLLKQTQKMTKQNIDILFFIFVRFNHKATFFFRFILWKPTIFVVHVDIQQLKK